jgi:hypothetical protein
MRAARLCRRSLKTLVAAVGGTSQSQLHAARQMQQQQEEGGGGGKEEEEMGGGEGGGGGATTGGLQRTRGQAISRSAGLQCRPQIGSIFETGRGELGREVQ